MKKEFQLSSLEKEEKDSYFMVHHGTKEQTKYQTSRSIKTYNFIALENTTKAQLHRADITSFEITLIKEKRQLDGNDHCMKKQQQQMQRLPSIPLCDSSLGFGSCISKFFTHLQPILLSAQSQEFSPHSSVSPIQQSFFQKLKLTQAARVSLHLQGSHSPV